MAACDERVGPRGPMGLPGQKGDTGASGSIGMQGHQGPQGLRGLTGIQGGRGTDGDKGDKGDTGLTGSAGVPGRDGEAGSMGNRGAAGLDGKDGQQGGPGAQGPTGAKGDQGAQGVPGNGRYILGSYASLVGIGNSSAIGDETLLFSQGIVGNTLSNDGDEIEFFINMEYFANDLVNIIFDIDLANRYTYSYINSDNDIRSIRVVITRVDATTQLWSIEDNVRNLVSGVIIGETLAAHTTSYDLTNPMTFEIFADNTTLGADQVLLKKCSMYLNKLH